MDNLWDGGMDLRDELKGTVMAKNYVLMAVSVMLMMSTASRWNLSLFTFHKQAGNILKYMKYILEY